MEYKAKVVAGLLTATCVFSIIALILSAVDVKDVFLPPGTKVKSLQKCICLLSLGCWLTSILRFSPALGSLCSYSPRWGQTAVQAGTSSGSVTVFLLTAHTAFSLQRTKETYLLAHTEPWPQYSW